MKKNIVIILLILGLFGLSFFFWYHFTMGNGSKSFAYQWYKKLKNINYIQDFKYIQDKYPFLLLHKFPENDQWIIGICDDSHSSPWGGTIVIHDSEGKTRCFFGHVCGNNFLHIVLLNVKNIKELYIFFIKNDFKEYIIET